MGCFDSFKVGENNKLNLPVPKDEYQTKDLGKNLILYQIGDDGVIKPTECNVWQGEFYLDEDEALEFKSGHYNGIIVLYGDLADGTWKEYMLVIENSTIVYIWDHGETLYTDNPDSEPRYRDLVNVHLGL
jgi:hypothetical protein